MSSLGLEGTVDRERVLLGEYIGFVRARFFVGIMKLDMCD